MPQLIDRVGSVGLVMLARGDDPCGHGTVLPLVYRPLVLQPVVLQEHPLVVRHLFQRDENRRFLDVRVVARAPFDGRQWRVRPEPLLAGGRGRQREVRVVVRTVALHFVEAAHRIVRVRNEEHVVRHPPVVEPIGEHAGHAALGHFHDVILRHDPPLIDRDGVELVVVWPGARARIQIRLRFVQIVQNGWRPLQKRPGGGPREREELAHAVPIVVVLHVFAPIHYREPRVAGRALLVVVVGIHHLLATVHLKHGRDERNHVAANVLDEGRLLHGQAVRQLHEHLGSTGLRRMHAAGDPVDRLGRLEQRLRLRLRRLARVRELLQLPLVVLEVPDGCLVRHGQHNHVAPFLALANAPDLDTR